MDPTLLTRALGAAALLFVCEASLARMAQQPIPSVDLLWSALGLGLLCVAPALWSTRLPDDRAPAVAASGVWVAAGLVGAAVAMPTAMVPAWATAMLGVAAGLLLLGLAPSAGVEGPPHPAVLLAGLATAWVLSWALSLQVPELGAVAATAAVWLVATALALRVEGAAVNGVLGGLVGAGVVLGPPAGWTATGPVPDGPDIVLITVDTLRADVGQQLPGFQRVAAGGAALPDTTAAAPWTLPSTATLLTGAPLHRHHAGRSTSGTQAIAADVPTLAERLSDHGYDTLAVVDRNMWLRPSSGVGRGFASFFHTRQRAPGGATATTGLPFFARLAAGLGLPARSELASERLVDRVLAGLSSRRDRPLFVWLHFMDVHLPYTHASEPSLAKAARPDILADPSWASPAGRTTLLAAHQHEAELVDTAIGRLLDAVGDDAVVVYTADHGEEIWEHGGFEHGHALWQQVVAVPLAIRGVRVPDAAAPVHHLDIAPTLLSAAGLPDPTLEGHDLAQPLAERTLLTGNLAHGLPGRQWAVRQGPYKAIFGDGDPRLYDVAADPGELVDLAPSQAHRVQQLGQATWHDLGTGGVAIELESDQRSALEALGYLRGAP